MNHLALRAVVEEACDEAQESAPETRPSGLQRRPPSSIRATGSEDALEGYIMSIVSDVISLRSRPRLSTVIDLDDPGDV